MGGFILAVLVITVVLVQRQWELTGEKHRFEALREKVLMPEFHLWVMEVWEQSRGQYVSMDTI